MDDRTADLEAAIDASPADQRAYEVLADHLQELGDPRGELIALQMADQSVDVMDRARALIEQHGLGLPAPVTRVRWRRGYASAIEIDPGAASRDELLAVLAHPSARFLGDVTIANSETGLQPAIDAIAAKRRPVLENLWLGAVRTTEDTLVSGDSYDVGDLGALWPMVPNLEMLHLCGVNQSLGTFELPRLTLLSITSFLLHNDAILALAASSMPEVSSIDLAFGFGQPQVSDLEHLLTTELPRLNHLSLSGSFLDELIEILIRTPILRRLEKLTLQRGLTDRGAEVIARHADAFAHLEQLELTRNFLSRTAIARVEGVAKIVRTGNQQESPDHDPNLYDY